MTTSQTIKNLRKKELNLSQEAFAERLGINAKTVGFWENGKNEPNKSNLLSICNEFNLPSDYFQNVRNVTNLNDDCVDIPVRGNLSASLGQGIEIVDETQTGVYSVSRKLMKDVGANPNNTDFVPCEGDSMYPTIEGGALLMVDRSKKEVFDGKIYCVRLNGNLITKRLQFIPPNSVKVISDNKEKYDPFYVDLSKTLDYDFEIIGEVKWYGTIVR